MDEALAKRRQYELASVNRDFLGTLVSLPKGRSGLQRELRDAFRAHGVEPGGLTSFTLRLAYDSVTHELNTKYGRLEIHRTAPERRFAKVFGQISKRKLLPSFWIGNHSVDYFCPSIRVGKYIGVAFEIDGSIHQRNFKQRKDTHGEDRLETLGIWTKLIENEDMGPVLTVKSVTIGPPIAWDAAELAAERVPPQAARASPRMPNRGIKTNHLMIAFIF